MKEPCSDYNTMSALFMNIQITWVALGCSLTHWAMLSIVSFLAASYWSSLLICLYTVPANLWNQNMKLNTCFKRSQNLLAVHITVIEHLCQSYSSKISLRENDKYNMCGCNILLICTFNQNGLQHLTCFQSISNLAVKTASKYGWASSPFLRYARRAACWAVSPCLSNKPENNCNNDIFVFLK